MTDASIAEKVRKLLLVEHFDEQARAKLVELGEDAVEAIQGHANGPRRGLDGLLKTRAIAALGDLSSDVALPTLQSALRDRDLDTRLRAASALGQLGGAEAVEALEARTQNTQSTLEISAIAGALSEIDLPEAATALDRVRLAVEDQTARSQIEQVVESRHR